MPKIGINIIFWKPKGAGGIETMLRSFISSISEVLPDFPDLEIYLLGTTNNLIDFKDLNKNIFCVPLCDRIDTLLQRIYHENFSVYLSARKLNLNLVHTMNYYGPIKLPCPSLVSILDMNYKAVPETFSPITRIGRSFLTRQSAHSSSAIMTISEFSKREIERYLAPSSPIVPIHLAPSQELISTNSKWPETVPIGEKYLFSLGSSFNHKNFHGLISSYEYYCKKITSSGSEAAKLYIAGVARSGSQKLANAVSSSKYSKDIRLLGPMPTRNLKALYENAFGFVFPSLYEGFGLPPLEAMALGCPVVCSNAASLPEIVGNAALLGNAGLADEFGSLICSLHDKFIRSRLIQAGENQLHKFSWSKAAKTLLNTYLKYCSQE